MFGYIYSIFLLLGRGAQNSVDLHADPVSVQTFSTPNYPQAYNNNLYCVWNLTAPGGYRVEVTFISFATEFLFDIVRVKDGDQETSTQLGIFFGAPNVPFTQNSTETRLRIEFKSDGFFEYAGFKASYIAIQGLN